MSNKIHRLYSTNKNLTAIDTLEAAKQDGYKELVILGYDTDNRLVIRFHNTSQSDVLWLAKQLELEALE